MKYLILCLAFLLSCSPKLIRDQAPASIDMGWKRLETTLCDRWEVGDNGCVFPEGKVGDATLHIYKVLRGGVSIIGQGCKVDHNVQYEYDEKNSWLDIKIADLIQGDTLDNDCVLTIYQRVIFPDNESSPFPVEGIYGTVTLGTCPAGSTCSFDSEQIRAGWHPDPIRFDVDTAGQYMLRGCGQELVPPSNFSSPLTVNVETLWPGGYPKEGRVSCLFILGVRGAAGGKFKKYHKVSIFREETLKLDSPSIVLDGDTADFRGDPAVSLVIAGDKIINDTAGDWHPNKNGDYLRFYTIKGRTLVVFIRNGVIEWTK